MDKVARQQTTRVQNETSHTVSPAEKDQQALLPSSGRLRLRFPRRERLEVDFGHSPQSTTPPPRHPWPFHPEPRLTTHRDTHPQDFGCESWWLVGPDVVDQGTPRCDVVRRCCSNAGPVVSYKWRVACQTCGCFFLFAWALFVFMLDTQTSNWRGLESVVTLLRRANQSTSQSLRGMNR